MATRHDEWDMVPESQRKANDKYQKDYIRQYLFKLNVRTDKDLIRFLDGVNNRQGLIKSLLRSEMERRSQNLTK